MKYEEKILKLFENGYLENKDVVKNNIPRIYLLRLLKENKTERVSRGIYAKKDTIIDDFVILQSKSKNVIFSNMTALYLYGFSNRIPIKYDITVPVGYNGNLQKLDNVNLFYYRKNILELGITSYKLESGNTIKIYDLERTICVLIKNKDSLKAKASNLSKELIVYNADYMFEVLLKRISVSKYKEVKIIFCSLK